ncbi:DMT family transporter [Candidatus Woesearchaeota archaeon]|nr:DMT family transporter [Candidatus Woesearchaeota archaeon]
MRLNPYVAVILGATFGATSGVFIKLLQLPPTTMTFFRVFIPTVAVLLYILFVKKTKLIRGNWKLMLGASALNAIRMFLYFVAYLYTTLGNAVIMSQTWPIFAAIFGMFFLSEKVTKRTIFLIALAFLGVIIMSLNKEISFANKEFFGMLVMMISGMIYAITAIIFKKELANYSKTETIFYQNVVGAVVFLPFIFINKPLPTVMQGMSGTIYGFLVGVIAFTLFFYGMKKLPMS